MFQMTQMSVEHVFQHSFFLETGNKWVCLQKNKKHVSIGLDVQKRFFHIILRAWNFKDPKWNTFLSSNWVEIIEEWGNLFFFQISGTKYRKTCFKRPRFKRKMFSKRLFGNDIKNILEVFISKRNFQQNEFQKKNMFQFA